MAISTNFPPVNFGNNENISLNTTEENNKKTFELFLTKYRSKISEETLRATFENIIKIQDELENEETRELNSNEKFPFRLIVQKNNFQVIDPDPVGRGTYATVFQEVLFPTSKCCFGSPGKSIDLAVKQANKPNFTFSPEKSRVENALDQSYELQSKIIDISLKTFKNQFKTSYSLHNFYEKNLRNINYDETSISDILNILEDAVKALSLFHKNEFIHRDIKGDNILVTHHNRGALTDFGFLRRVPKTPHQIIGSPTYLEPSSYGNHNNYLINLRNRHGLQTKANDMFAFGRMLEIDVLIPLVEHFGSQFSISSITKIEKLLKLTIQGPFTDEDLSKYGESNKYNAIYYKCHQKNIEYIHILKSPEERLKILSDSINCLNKNLDRSNIMILKNLAQLSYSLQNTPHESRSNAEQTIEILQSIRNINISNDQSKMKRKPEKTEDNSISKKVRLDNDKESIDLFVSLENAGSVLLPSFSIDST